MVQMAEQALHGPSGIDRSTEPEFSRTRAAYERTMMGWIRTAILLIIFEFSIYKFFQIEAPRDDQRAYLIGPREFAVMLVSIGLLSLLLASVEYHQQIRTFRMESQTIDGRFAVFVAALMPLLGLITLFGAFSAVAGLTRKVLLSKGTAQAPP
jgi:putative membrane protein